MNKPLTFLTSAVAVLFIIGIFAFVSAVNEDSSLGDSGNVSQQVSDIVNSSVPTLPVSVSEYVEEFVSKKGINPDKISDVSQVSFDDLPKEVNIENVNDNNLAIYEVNYNETPEEQKKMFVITYSVDKLSTQGDLIVSHDKRMFLNFGLNKEIANSEFLNTASGVEGSLEKGYVMMREGSITGISTVLDITQSAEQGQIEIVIYKNGIPIGFGNTISSDAVGVKKDYDVQSKGVVSFEPGDVISAYVKVNGSLKDVITLIEITTVN
jgi:hypothetical protein